MANAASASSPRARSPLAEAQHQHHHQHHHRLRSSTPSNESTSPRSPSSPLRYPTFLSASQQQASSGQPQSPSKAHSGSAGGSCFVHSHLDHSLADAIQRDAAARLAQRKKGKRRADEHRAGEDGDSTASEGDAADDQHNGNESDDEEDEEPSLTRQLAETAVSVREMSKQLGTHFATFCFLARLTRSCQVVHA